MKNPTLVIGACIALLTMGAPYANSQTSTHKVPINLAPLPCDVAQRLLNSPPCGQVKEKFFIAYVTDGQYNIHARYSLDGSNWQPGNFPTSATGTGAPTHVTVPFAGVGASADSLGLFHNVIFDQGSELMDVWGLGAAIWDSWGERTRLPSAITSAPAVVDIGDGRRIIAVRQAGDTLGVFLYNYGSNPSITPLSMNFPGFNSGVIARPAIARRGDGKILLAWPRGIKANIPTDIMIQIGSLNSSGAPIFPTLTRISLAGIDLDSSALAAPAVACDDRYFYVAVLQSYGQATGFTGYRFVIYRSRDGSRWTEFTRLSSLDVNTTSILGLASKSNGTLVAAAITNNNRYISNKAQLCVRASSGASCTWSDVSTSVFGTPARYADFALIRTATP